MEGRTFRGAIWDRDHASPSNLGLRISPFQRAFARAVRVFLRRERGEICRFIVVLTGLGRGPSPAHCIAIVSIGMGILMNHMSTDMDTISTSEYCSRISHAQYLDRT